MPENDILKEVFQHNLKRLLDQKQATQRDLAEYMMVSPVTVNDWIRGRKLPRMDKVDRLCEYFSVPRSALMERGPSSEHLASIETRQISKDERDLNKFLERAEVMFDGDTYKLTADDREKIHAALKLAFYDAKKRNRRKKD